MVPVRQSLHCTRKPLNKPLISSRTRVRSVRARVLVLAHGCWCSRTGAGARARVLVRAHGCWCARTGAGARARVLVRAHGCWRVALEAVWRRAEDGEETTGSEPTEGSREGRGAQLPEPPASTPNAELCGDTPRASRQHPKHRTVWRHARGFPPAPQTQKIITGGARAGAVCAHGRWRIVLEAVWRHAEGGEETTGSEPTEGSREGRGAQIPELSASTPNADQHPKRRGRLVQAADQAYNVRFTLAGIAQLVEQLLRKQLVGGSSPLSGTRQAAPLCRVGY